HARRAHARRRDEPPGRRGRAGDCAAPPAVLPLCLRRRDASRCREPGANAAAMTLEADKNLKLRLPGSDPLPAVVEQVDDASITIALLLKPHLTLSNFQDRSVTVEYADSKGLHQLRCTVVSDAPGDRLILTREPE